MLLMDIGKLIVTGVVAYYVGKGVTRLGMPAILGWLVTGMALGPHGVGLLGDSILEAGWYTVTESILECMLGLMIGTELIWAKLKRSGKQILVTTMTESLGAFVVVSLVFGVIFTLTQVPVYLAFLFGGIALATAPAPSLSIVNQMKTAGPVTSTLIPMAVLDDLVAALVFFTVVAFTSAHISTQSLSVGAVLVMVFLPVPLGMLLGWLSGLLLRRVQSPRLGAGLLAGALVLAAAFGMYLNQRVLPMPALNFMLLGMGLSAVVANMLSQSQRDAIMARLNPVINVALLVLILNLGAPLDYHLILGAGIYTAVYILARAAGKYGGAYLGAALTGAEPTVKKYLGFTLLPHSGVSLVFTGIAVSLLQDPAPECAAILQGTIAAAAVINEFIAVLTARKGFAWAGELYQAKEAVEVETSGTPSPQS